MSSSGSGDESSGGGGSRRAPPPSPPGGDPSASGSAAPPPVPLGVAPFENGQYVRLRNRGRGGYLFADESGRGLCTDKRRGMINTVWGVQILETPQTVHVVLRGAYGRHLAASRGDLCPGHIGFVTAQCIFEEMEDTHVMWCTTPGKRGSVILLHSNAGSLRALRANGRYRRWQNGVTVEPFDRNRISSMMEWEVQILPMTMQRPQYQLGRAATRFGPSGSGSQAIIQVGYDMANSDGDFNGRGGSIFFNGRSLIELGNALEERFRRWGDGFVFRNMTLFIRAGSLGQLFPLITDLPTRDDDIDVVVFLVGTPGHYRLRFPDLDAA